MPVSAEKMVPGSTVVVLWEANKQNANSVKSNKIEGGTTSKIILPSRNYTGTMPRPGEWWIATVERESSKSPNKGAFFVVPVQQRVNYTFEGVYLEDVKARLIACVLQDPKRNLMLQGEQGTGKSTISNAIAKSLGWKYRKISGGLIKKAVYMLGRYVPHSDGKPVALDMDEAMLAKFQKFGASKEDGQVGFNSNDPQLLQMLMQHMMNQSTKSLSFKWADSKLVSVLREAHADQNHTYLVMIDEFTRIDEDARDALLDVIEGQQRFLRLVTGEEIPVGRNVKFMAAGNVGEGFTTKRSDAAQDDRWEIIKITAMPAEEELKHCLRLYPSCPKVEMKQAIDGINAVRAARRDANQQISKTVSTRRAEAIAMYLSRGFKLEEALEAAVANQFDGALGDQNSQAAKVMKIMLDAIAQGK